MIEELIDRVRDIPQGALVFMLALLALFMVACAVAGC
jgi:hypothetical protein